jgi:hypothetical protein
MLETIADSARRAAEWHVGGVRLQSEKHTLA